jgi:hypothetical protein
MPVTFATVQETYTQSGWGGRRAVPAWHARAESGGVTGQAGLGSGVRTGRRGGGARAPTCAREWSSRHWRPDVWALVRLKKLSDLKVNFESSVSLMTQGDKFGDACAFKYI